MYLGLKPIGINSFGDISSKDVAELYKYIPENFPLITKSEKLKIVNFCPKAIKFNDIGNLTLNELIEKGNKKLSIELSFETEILIPKIQRILENSREARDPECDWSVESKNKAIEDYNRLNNILETFLEARLGRSKRGIVTLFGQEIHNAPLSV